MSLSNLFHLLRLASSLSSSPPSSIKISFESLLLSFNHLFPTSHLSQSLSHSFDRDHQLKLIISLLYQAHQFSSALDLSPINPLSPSLSAALKTCFSSSSNSFNLPTLPFSIAPQYLARFQSPNLLLANLKRILSVCALNCLISIHAQLSSLPPPSSDQPPILGSRDIKTLQGLAQAVANWGIYHLLATSTSIHLGFHPPNSHPLTRFEPVEDQHDSFTALCLQDILRSLLQIFLPPPNIQGPSSTLPHPILQPTFAFQSALLSTLFVPLVAGTITLRLTPTSAQFANDHLDRLLDLSDPKTVFSSLLSLRAIPHNACHSASGSNFRTHVSQILSTRLARPSGLRGLLQAVMSDDYNDDDEVHLGQPAKTTSATLNRLDSLYLIISNCPASLERSVYFERVLKTLVQLVLPGFFFDKDSQREEARQSTDSLRRAACYVLSQMVVNQPTVFGAHLSPILHAPLRPSLRHSGPPPDPLGILVHAAEIRQSLRLINELVINSDPSPRLIERLVLPVLPQLVSLLLFLLKTKAEPELRGLIEGLVGLWIKMSELGQVPDWIRKCVRELEIGRELDLGRRDEVDSRPVGWARDADGAVCVRVKQNKDEDPMVLRPDPEGLAIWLESLNNPDLVGMLLVKWLDDLETLRGRSGFAEAKMSLFRMQVVLKVIEKIDCSRIQDPVHVLNFIKHSLACTTKPIRTVADQKSPVQLEPTGLASLRVVEEVEDGDEADGEAGEHERAILVAGLTLLLSVIEANPSMDERKVPVLQEITGRLDELLLAQGQAVLSGQVHELGMQCRLMLSVRSALAKVDELSFGAEWDEGRCGEEESDELRKQYTEGLALVQDACVPLRSQGIAMLKDVLLSRPKSTQASELVDSLAPSVVEILLRLIEEDDSFVYLNAVKGLSALAEKYSGVVCQKLNVGYGEVLEGGLRARGAEDDGSRMDVDRRLRIGEAMVQVIQRAGSALSLYIDKLLPSLLVAFHSIAFPAAVRASAVTILTSCVEASLSTMGVHVAELVESCVAVLSTQSYARPRPEKDEESGEADKADGADKADEADEAMDPTRAGATHPVLRRAAIMFILSAFTQASMASGNVYAREIGKLLGTVERVLGYVGAVDPDRLVREQAQVAWMRIREMGVCE